MEMEQADAGGAAEVMRILTLCVGHLRSHGIQQWDDTYPNLEAVESDARSQSLFLARENGMCVGAVGLNEEQPAEYASLQWVCDGRALIVHRLCVHPDWQRRGIGRYLMDFAEAFAKRCGFACIRLDAYTGNRRALALYRRRGYRRIGQVYFPRRSLPFDCFEMRVV
jgi:ribosomal protein S18 acetylase RimI-like enzyme